MSDLITRVREQAEKASREAYGFNGVRGHDSRNGTRRKAFIAGAVWAASRVTPTREQIAEELSKHHFIHGIGRSNSCHCGAQVGEFAEYRNHEADAILALLNGDTDD